jgi:hypothetical protein
LARKKRPTEISLEPGTVYFIGERDLISGEETPYVKIGLTKLDRTGVEREADLKTGNPRELFVMHEEYVPLVHSVERALRYEFRLQNVLREWHVFRPDSPKKLTEAISLCQDLGREFADYVPIVGAARDIAKTESRGEIKKATSPDAEHWLREYWLHSHVLSLGDKATEKYSSLAKVAAAEGKPAPQGTTTTQSPRQTVNWKRFEAEHPEISALFQIAKSSRGFKPVKIALSDLSDPLVSEVQERCARFDELFECRNDEDSLYSDLFRQLLMIEEIANFSSFRKELARCQMSVLCGDAPGIEGVLDWQTKVESRLDTKAVESAHSQLVSQYREIKMITTTRTGAAGEIAGETEE